jgi:tight adherence protein B
MIILGLAFTVILIVTFGLIVFILKPSSDEEVAERRIALIIPQHVSRRDRQITQESRLAQSDSSPFRLLEEKMRGSSVLRNLQSLLLQAQSRKSAGSILMMMAFLFLVTFLIAYLLTSLLPFAFGIALIIGYIPIGVLRFRKSRRIAAFNAELPDCIETCARCLRAGYSIVAAVEVVATMAGEPARTEFAEVFKKQNYGLPLRDALMQMLDRVPSMDLRVFVTGILVQKDTGGNLAEILDRIVSVVRDRNRIQGEIRTHTAQGRLTGWILCLLPIVLLVLINLTNPGYSSVLFNDPFGRKMLYIAGGLLVVGVLIIRQIVNGIEV